MLKKLAGATHLLMAGGTSALAQNAPTATAQTTPGRMITMAEAIAAAQARVPGGVWEAEIETRDSRRIYEIELVSGGRVHEVQVDAMNGQVLATEEEPIEGKLKQWFAEGRMQAAESAQNVLALTIPEIEKQMGGRVTEVSLEREDGRIVYELEVETAGGERDIQIDASTGQNISQVR